jgi:uncharacterized protein YggE
MKTFLLLFVAFTSLAWADGLPNVPYLYVEGNAAVEKKADLVSLRFKLSATDVEVSKANSPVQTQALKVFALLKAVGIADQDVIAGDIQSDAEYDEIRGDGMRGKIRGYRVQRDFTVKVRELVQFPKLVNDLFAANVRYFDGVTPEYSKAKESEQEAQEMAIKDARIEAEKTAKLAGMKVDTVWAISPINFSQIQRQMLGEFSYSVAQGPAEATKAEAAPEYRIASVKFFRSVQVIYLISPAK